MRSLIQLVTYANVSIAGNLVSSINRGILALIGIEKSDTATHADKLFDRIIHYRIFPDHNDKMNLCLKDIQGQLLLVPQFTIVAETQKGTRPGFSTGMPPDQGKILFNYLVDHAKAQYPLTQAGVFGANMQVSLCNDGPVTFLLESR